MGLCVWVSRLISHRGHGPSHLVTGSMGLCVSAFPGSSGLCVWITSFLGLWVCECRGPWVYGFLHLGLLVPGSMVSMLSVYGSLHLHLWVYESLFLWVYGLYLQPWKKVLSLLEVSSPSPTSPSQCGDPQLIAQTIVICEGFRIKNGEGGLKKCCHVTFVYC